MSPRDAIWLAGVLVFFAALFMLMRVAARIGRRYTRATQAWAAANGWQYLPALPQLQDRWSSFPFGRGTMRLAGQGLTREVAGFPILSADYRFAVNPRGGRGRVHTFHVLTLQLPVALPGVQLVPERLSTQLATMFGGQDLDLELAPFNATWRVRGQDPAAVHAFLHPRMMERLMHPDASSLGITVEGTDLILWVPASTSRPSRQRFEPIPHRVALLLDIVRLVPTHLWREHGHDPYRDPRLP